LALIKNLKAKPATARISVSLTEPVLRKLDGYRLYLGEVNGYLPDRAQTIEQFLLYVFGEDKAFVKWYLPSDPEQYAMIDSLQKRDARAAPGPARSSEDPQNLSYE
jgi:hypothetical protein